MISSGNVRQELVWLRSADLLTADGLTAASSVPLVSPLAPRMPHFAPKAKHVIFMFMEGGPSQYELFDPKPALEKYHGSALPPSLTKDLNLAFIKPTAAMMASKFKFQHYGQSGTSSLSCCPIWVPVPTTFAWCVPCTPTRSIIILDSFNSLPGRTQFGRPTMGAWTVYGLGSESQNLPGFVVLTSGVGTSGGASNFSSGFLPSHYQGTVFRNSGDPILYLSNPQGIGRESQKAALDAIRDLNEEHFASTGDLEIASRISSYELAFRMQAEGPDLLSFKDEPQSILDMYGVNSDEEDLKQYATNCLLATPND